MFVLVKLAKIKVAFLLVKLTYKSSVCFGEIGIYNINVYQNEIILAEKVVFNLLKCNIMKEVVFI